MMNPLPTMGLRTRIVIALAVVMTLFIVLTELSVSQLVRVAMSRQIVAAHTIEGREMLDEHLEQDLWNLRKLIFFYMVVGATVAIILGSWTVTRLVVRPLSRITSAVEQVSEGRLEMEVPIAGAGELVRLGIAFNRMTTTLREQQDELRSQLDELEKSSVELKAVQDRLIRAAKLASVGTLAAGVAHEIGNPLAGVLGLLGALDEEDDDRKATDYRALMRKEIERIDRIINDLVVYARPARSETTVGASSNVEDVFKHVHALLGAQKLFDGVSVETRFAGGPWTVAVSRDDMTQILINLLLNAAQAMNGNGTVSVKAKRINEWRPGLTGIAREAVQIGITDTGPGIPDEHISQIFDPFYSKRATSQGTGLGLAICQSICERAGGEITFDREHRMGTRFVITFQKA